MPRGYPWRIPGDGQATLYTIGGDPGEGGSEEFVGEALDVLVGRPLRPA